MRVILLSDVPFGALTFGVKQSELKLGTGPEDLFSRLVKALLRRSTADYRGGTSEVSIFFVVPISRQRGGGGCQLAAVCVSPRPPARRRRR